MLIFFSTIQCLDFVLKLFTMIYTFDRNCTKIDYYMKHRHFFFLNAVRLLKYVTVYIIIPTYNIIHLLNKHILKLIIIKILHASNYVLMAWHERLHEGVN